MSSPMPELRAWILELRSTLSPIRVAGYVRTLKTSRQRILATADRVVPGHGEPFEAGRSS
jgi:hypothetical protein